MQPLRASRATKQLWRFRWSRENAVPIEAGRELIMAQDVSSLFLNCSCKTLMGEYWPRMRKALEPLTDEQIWWRPNEASNSIGNLLLHLNGNVHQWIVATFNGLDDARNRPVEFSERDRIPASEMLGRLGATLEQASAVIERLTTEELAAPIEIQGYHTTGLGAVYHVVEHFGMHYGQILYIVKALTGGDLNFYPELKQTGRAFEIAARE
jgi:uncharacterized damage-inducible protein DinB